MFQVAGGNGIYLSKLITTVVPAKAGTHTLGRQ